MAFLPLKAEAITFKVPQYRDDGFFTDMFYRDQRSEQALMLAMMQMVIASVSTGKIKRVTEELCGQSFSEYSVRFVQKVEPCR